MTDLINSAPGYISFSDFIISSDKEEFNYNIFKKDAIIFCKTDYIHWLFEKIQFSNRKYILITHNSDYLITERNFNKRPNCIKRWYAWTVAYEHQDLIEIPIGFGVMYDENSKPVEFYQNWLFNNSERLKQIKKDEKTVYCNYTIDYLRPSRHKVAEKIMKNGVNCYIPESKNTMHGRLLFNDYCEDMSKYLFVASPPGNGGDCHRTWDALYVGSIPIVIKNDLIYKNFDLPILQVNDYSEVTPKLLEDYLYYYNNHSFKWEQSTLSYWRNKILEDLKNIK